MMMNIDTKLVDYFSTLLIPQLRRPTSHQTASRQVRSGILHPMYLYQQDLLNSVLEQVPMAAYLEADRVTTESLPI
jgi:hypothetical protein